jgi:hypothetical protein
MLLREAIRPGEGTGLGMLLRTKKFVQIEDITKGKAYADRDPLRVATVEVAGGRTLVEVPLLKDDELIDVLRHDAFKSKLAGVLEDNLPVTFQMLDILNAAPLFAEQLEEFLLALQKRLRPVVFAVQFQ